MTESVQGPVAVLETAMEQALNNPGPSLSARPQQVPTNAQRPSPQFIGFFAHGGYSTGHTEWGVGERHAL